MTALVLTRHETADSLLAQAGGYLTHREAEHNLLLGICGQLRPAPQPRWRDAYLAHVQAGTEVVAVAMRTPPHNLVLSEVDRHDAVDLLVDDAAQTEPELPGVLGPKEASRRFADLWQERVGRAASRGMAQRIFCCERVLEPPAPGGAMRRAQGADRPLLVDWFGRFLVETFAELRSQPEQSVDYALERPGREGPYLWEDPSPVALAGCGSPTPNGIRIGPVYTPHEHRRRGYASALVAELTQHLLAGGTRFCFLFTDLANPTSNRIYRRIGYEAVTDVDEYRFATA
ncbi:MAG: GNAT family N-acetyltransferase [Gaiellaceae bacterium]